MGEAEQRILVGAQIQGGYQCSLFLSAGQNALLSSPAMTFYRYTRRHIG